MPPAPRPFPLFQRPDAAGSPQGAERTADGVDAALFGKNPTPRIVDVEPLMDRPSDQPAWVRLYRRSEDGERIETEEDRLYPFFFLSDITLLRGHRSTFKFTELDGENPFRYLVIFNTWGDYWNALRAVERRSDTDGDRPEELYQIGSPAQQYMMQTGTTCFLDMTLDDLHRLQLDIEVYSEHGFPNADRPEDRIIIVALSDNRGWTDVLSLQEQTDDGERALLRRLVEVLRERDPDVIEGYNCFSFDFDYILSRCTRLGVDFAIGRDGSTPRTYDSSMRFAERTVDYPAMAVHGRHIIDVYFQVMAFDVFKRDLPDYSLKTAAKYFGFAPEDRTYIDGDEIDRYWREERDVLLDYALDDVVETERLARHLSGSTFYLTQMLPMTYGASARRGPASKIESLFVREYLRRRHSIPQSEWGSQSMGGYTDIFITGVLGPVVYADVESLYPSIMLNYDIQPDGDALGVFPALLDRLTDLRLQTKQDMREADDEEVRSELDARQSSYKVLINSFYGNLGFSLSAFNDFAEADRVARIGQKILRQLIDAIRERGGTVIEVDTDGVLFVPPDDIRGEDAEVQFTRDLTAAMPDGIRVGFDGRFKKMLSYKKKNYALLTYDDTLKFKGSSLISRSNEAFGRRFVREAIRLLLDHDIASLHDLYMRYRDAIENSDWESVESFARTETLKDTIEQYEQDVQDGKRPRAATYELARRRSEDTGQPIRKGDRISYYITGDGPNVTAFEHCKLADEWDPDNPDENTAYYLKRLDQFSRKFDIFFRETDFRLIFSPEDLFGFSAEGIDIQQTRREPDDTGDSDVPF
jgi:DNA polymerase elongation subunit (family B)